MKNVVKVNVETGKLMAEMMRKAFEEVRKGNGKGNVPGFEQTWEETLDNTITALERLFLLKE